MAFLRVYLNDELQEQIELTGEKLTVGRTAENDLVLNSPGISSHHATIRQTEKSFSIEDVGSTNGVFVNGDQIQRYELKYWDEIQIYNYVLKFMASARARNDLAYDAANSETDGLNGTVAVSIDTINDLRNLKQLGNDAYLQLLEPDGSESIHTVKNAVFTIGTATNCNLQTRGWLGPKVSSQIEKRGRDYFLVPGRWGKITLNGNRISDLIKLKDNDFLGIGGLRIRFHLPVYPKAQQA